MCTTCYYSIACLPVKSAHPQVCHVAASAVIPAYVHHLLSLIFEMVENFFNYKLPILLVLVPDQLYTSRVLSVLHVLADDLTVHACNCSASNSAAQGQ